MQKTFSFNAGDDVTIRAAPSLGLASPVTSGGVAHMIVGAVCGALAVCGLQLFMVLTSEAALKRSVDGVS